MDKDRSEIEFRKNVLKEFIRNLERAHGHFLEDSKRAKSGNPDLAFDATAGNVPRLQLDALWGDALDVILDGLKRAIDGDGDPFRLKLPKGGEPKVSDLDRFDMAVDAYRAWKRDGKDKDAALEDTAEKYSCEGSEISPSTVRDALRKWEKSIGERLLDVRYCEQQRDLLDVLHRAATTPHRTTLR